ncbi:MAG: galactokinase [Clostridia bacterium]|nr:galactokinase [Clostridia bacterium]
MQLIRALNDGSLMEQLTWLYGSRNGELVSQTNRCKTLLSKHEKHFGADRPVWLISAPGRAEIGGNHTDHNRGRVLAASVSMDTLAAVSPREDRVVQVRSEGYAPMTLTLDSLEPRPEEEGTTAALIRGVAQGMAERGFAIGGFDAVVHSTVASGSGLSSSAAFEVLVSAIFDQLFNRFDMDFVTRAKISQYAENVHFGKPSGLLDQMASAAGGLVAVDFAREEPEVRRLSFDFAARGYALAVVATGGSHADLTADYAAIPAEMKQVAACLGEEVLRRVRPEEFQAALPTLRGKVSDRALLRAMHFFAENDRVLTQVEALDREDMPAFLEAIIASGRSSYMYLQNVWASPAEQGLALALALAEEMLAGKGAWRVHGGGFAGTTLNFVPLELLDGFVSRMDSVFGQGACRVLNIRPVGAWVMRV